VPHDVAKERIAAAVAAGGRVVDDEEAPSFVVLADLEGNQACVCTCLNR
jgi:4a-hydroxytetrahydrobiopterin dehydratase